MNIGFIFVVLLAVIAGTLGMVFVASHTSTAVTADSYGKMPVNEVNMTKQNVTDTMPTGINIMGFIAVIVAVLIVVAAIAAITLGGRKGYSSSRL